MYNRIIKCIDCLNKSFSSAELNFVKHIFVFGSVSKGCIHYDSDIDLLVIGDKPKSIELVSYINKILDKYNCTDVEVDLKYYDIDTFRVLRNSNVFLKSIEKDCIRLEEIKNELLRFCN